MQLTCVIKTVVLTYNINIIIHTQALRDAFIQHTVVFLTQNGLRICPPYSFVICIWIVIFNSKIKKFELCHILKEKISYIYCKILSSVV